MRTRDDSRRALAELRLPSVVTSVFDGRPIPEALRYRCEPPFHVFTTESVVPGGVVAPLWECGVRVTAYRDAIPAGGFIQFSLESPEEVRLLGHSFATVVADLLVKLWEDEVPEAELREVARVFEFEDIDRLISDLAALGSLSYQAHRRWLADILMRYE